MRLLIWDLPTRLFHWLLVGCVGFCALSGFLLPDTWFGWHFLCGYGIGLLLLFRAVWGLLGPEHSRWTSFPPVPSAIIAHVKSLLTAKPHRSLGHNPAGGAMIYALLATLTGLVVTGLIVLGGEAKQGPLAGLVPFAAGIAVKELHEFLADVILLLAALHVGGVLVESRLLRENLILTMIDGHKAAAPGTPPPRPRSRRALAVLGGVVVLVGLGVAGLERLPVLGWRPVAVPAAYAKECGACHNAYHPSLLPAASWASVMGHLYENFGEDASLPAASTSDLTAWLTANAAETCDTEAANRLRVVSAVEPGRITASPWWMRKHRHIADTVFQQNSVKSHANCTACHQDAERGAFAVQAISIPKP